MKYLSNIVTYLVVVLIAACSPMYCPEPLETTEKQTSPPPPRIEKVISSPDQISDTYVNSYYSDSLDGGAKGWIVAAGWTFGGNYGTVRSYMNFDLSDIAPELEVESAKLTLYAETRTVLMRSPAGHNNWSGSNSWKVKRVLEPWSENTFKWGTQPAFDDVGAISISASTSEAQAYTIDVTHFILDQLNSPSQYHGLVFQLDDESQWKGLQFYSSDNSFNALLRPKLVITFK